MWNETAGEWNRDLVCLSEEDLGLFTQEARGMQFPRSHTHKLAVHRGELVDAFCESRYLTYWKLAMKSTTETKKEIEGKGANQYRVYRIDQNTVLTDLFIFNI